MSFEGKVVIVTGSSSGIGQSAAELFAAKGASLTIHGQNEERLQKTVELLKKNGVSESRLLVVRGPIEKEETRKQLIDETVKKFGRLDVLVNNAACGQLPGLVPNSLENLDYLYQTNLRSVYHLFELALPHVLKTKGNIVNVSSVGGKQSYPDNIPYVILKSALDHLTRNLALKHAADGIRVNTVSPGATLTNFVHTTGKSQAEIDGFFKFFADNVIPNKRSGSPKEVANVIVFLASEEASYVTGSDYVVDGGVMAGRSSSGIGQATALLFAQQGANVTIHGQSEEKMKSTVELFTNEKKIPIERIHSILGPIESEETQKKLIDETIEKFGQLDVLVCLPKNLFTTNLKINNAGLSHRSDLDPNSLENLGLLVSEILTRVFEDYVMQINLKSLIAMTRLAVPHLEKTKGNVVNVSSIGGQRTGTNWVPYLLTKASVDHYTRNAAIEYADQGIRVNAVSPGATITAFLERHNVPKYQADAFIRHFEDNVIPLRRLGQADEIANVIEFLASNKASYCTGSNFVVDGGILAGPPIPRGF
ncbi:hypothetical protein M3Y98_01221000 [Aphelenchoides besseyi]|nr:hypothetical protein M3Y98_01221000 [Aphelenchoides besseyi]KAI6193338.1 hypothetical protein M3Y96_01007500 [Aphelenchoides besseyi]